MIYPCDTPIAIHRTKYNTCFVKRRYGQFVIASRFKRYQPTTNLTQAPTRSSLMSRKTTRAFSK
jgi:hypothetical protein